MFSRGLSSAADAGRRLWMFENTPEFPENRAGCVEDSIIRPEDGALTGWPAEIWRSAGPVQLEKH